MHQKSWQSIKERFIWRIERLDKLIRAVYLYNSTILAMDQFDSYHTEIIGITDCNDIRFSEYWIDELIEKAIKRSDRVSTTILVRKSIAGAPTWFPLYNRAAPSNQLSWPQSSVIWSRLLIELHLVQVRISNSSEKSITYSNRPG